MLEEGYSPKFTGRCGKIGVMICRLRDKHQINKKEKHTEDVLVLACPCICQPNKKGCPERNASHAFGIPVDTTLQNKPEVIHQFQIPKMSGCIVPTIIKLVQSIDVVKMQA